MSTSTPTPEPLEEALRTPRPRGLATLSPERRKEISAKGGKASHAAGKAHMFTPEKARAAGAKGGATSQARGTAHRFSSEEAIEAGKKGGTAPRRDRIAPTPLPAVEETE